MKHKTSELTGALPTELPRFAKSFRAFIDHPDHDTRLLTSEWMDDAAFPRFTIDFAPLLQRAGRLGFIASTVPASAHDDVERYYGMKNPPQVVWWWRDGAWQSQHTREAVERFCARIKVPVALFDVPRSQ